MKQLLNECLKCLAINECDSPELNDCDSNAVCMDMFASFTCECVPGYTGNGVNCTSMCTYQMQTS
ncbi:MAG: hypothetical protein HFP76_00905 [Methylococcales symbiont of Iophon sp. n. MRB-2018]|nr:MAG: hypothetical protein HFP76_00905 [Methylococcales symbiont of Iophon sp. n. MRB-2018]